MRKYFYLSLFLLAAMAIAAVRPVARARAANACYPPLAGLSGWWPGNGNTKDVVGGRDAVLHDDATTGPGLIGQAFVLDGDGDFVDVPHDPALNLGTGDFTAALWVRFNDTAGEQVLLEKWIQRSSVPSEGWTLTKLEGDILRLAMSSATANDTNVDSAPLTIPTETWIHLAATRQDGEVTLFMNGQPVATGSYSGTLDSTASLKFGHRGSPSDTPGSEDERGVFLNGRIDAVQLFAGRALPQSSIQAIYDAGSLGQCTVTTAAAVPPPAPTPSPATAELLYPKLTGAFIELQAEPLRPGLWTRIQWQDAASDWHDIEGWQGLFNPDQKVLWYVGEEHLGTGPFRWLVYESQGGALLASSAPFDLPARGGEVLHVKVSLPAPVIAEVYDEDGDLTSVEWATVIPLEENVAAARPVVVTTNGADDDRENPGVEPADITDGRLDYLAAGDALEDGVVGYVNDDLNQRMVITVTIDLEGTYDISRIRYNMGDVQRAESWHADVMTTPLGTTTTNPGTPQQGAWTEHTGSATLSRVTIVLEKTRISYETDWLFIGEIEVYGIPAANSPLVRDRF